MTIYILCASLRFFLDSLLRGIEEDEIVCVDNPSYECESVHFILICLDINACVEYSLADLLSSQQSTILSNKQRANENFVLV